MMNKVCKYVLPWVLAALLVVGSCLPVMAAESEAYAKWGAYYETAIAYCEEKGIDCTYIFMTYVSSTSVIFYVSAEPFTVNNRVITSGDAVLYRLEMHSTSSVYSHQSRPANNAYYSHSTIIASNFDIYATGSSDLYLAADTDFFHRPSPLQTIVETAQPKMTEVLKEVLTMTPLLIPLLAGYLGLRKALRLISAILRTA